MSTAHNSLRDAVFIFNMDFPFSNISGFVGSLWSTPLFRFAALTNALILNDSPSKSPFPCKRCKYPIALKRVLDAPHPFLMTVCAHVKKHKMSTSQLCFAVSTHGDISLASQKRVRISQFLKYTACVSPANEFANNLTVSSISERFTTSFRQVCAFETSGPRTRGAPASAPPPHRYRKCQVFRHHTFSFPYIHWDLLSPSSIFQSSLVHLWEPHLVLLLLLLLLVFSAHPAPITSPATPLTVFPLRLRSSPWACDPEHGKVRMHPFHISLRAVVDTVS